MKTRVDSFEELITKSSHHKYYKDLTFDPLTWDEVIDNIDRCITEDLSYKARDNYGFVSHDTLDILKIYPVLNKIKNYYPDIEITSHLYTSFSRMSKTFGKHNDVMDVVIWQCIGTTHWIIYDDQIYHYKLKPGEFLYIPAQMYHDTNPITPRSSVSFGIEHFRTHVEEWKTN